MYQENFEWSEMGTINLFVLYFWNVVQILQQELWWMRMLNSYDSPINSADLFRVNLTVSPSCACGYRNEDVFHYLFKSPCMTTKGKHSVKG